MSDRSEGWSETSVAGHRCDGPPIVVAVTRRVDGKIDGGDLNQTPLLRLYQVNPRFVRKSQQLLRQIRLIRRES